MLFFWALASFAMTPIPAAVIGRTIVSLELIDKLHPTGSLLEISQRQDCTWNNPGYRRLGNVRMHCFLVLWGKTGLE